jgi:hypothetical protein
MEKAGEGARRRTGVAATGAVAPARQRSKRGNRRWRGLLCTLEDGLGRLNGRGS